MQVCVLVYSRCVQKNSNSREDVKYKAVVESVDPKVSTGHILCRQKYTRTDMNTYCVNRKTLCTDENVLYTDRKAHCTDKNVLCTDRNTHCTDRNTHCTDRNTHCTDIVMNCVYYYVSHIPAT